MVGHGYSRIVHPAFLRGSGMFDEAGAVVSLCKIDVSASHGARLTTTSPTLDATLPHDGWDAVSAYVIVVKCL